MITVKRFENKPVNSNCYIIFNDFSDRCVIIDPGTKDCTNIIPYINDKNLTPEYVILTHEHFDHIWGVNFLRKKYNIKLVSNKATSRLISNKKKNLSLFHNQIGFECLNSDIIFEKLIELKLINEDFTLFCTPGHSEGSISINVGNFLFTGDTLIKEVKSITKLPGGDKEKLTASLNFIFNNFYLETIVSPGHGEPGFLKEFSKEYHNKTSKKAN